MDPHPVRLSTGSVVADALATAHGRPSTAALAALADDVDTAIDLGLGHVRITIPWASIEPRQGTYVGDATEALLAASRDLRQAGVAVWFALLSPVVPPWFADEGGFTDPRAAARWWPRWVETVAERFGADADGWVPMEAPTAMADRLCPDDPRRHGEVVHTLVVAWRDAWRILRGPLPVATSLDVRHIAIPAAADVGPRAVERARYEDHIRWTTWLRALRDGVITIPGRVDRHLDDLAGGCDVLGVAVSTARGDDLEPLLVRTAEQGPDRPLAITARPRGDDPDTRAEAVAETAAHCARLAGSLPLQRLTFTDLAAVATSRS